MFEYGSRASFWRLWRIFTERKLATTVFGVATALRRNPQIVAAMNKAGWDIASHGLRWVEHKDMCEARRERASADRGPRHNISTAVEFNSEPIRLTFNASKAVCRNLRLII